MINNNDKPSTSSSSSSSSSSPSPTHPASKQRHSDITAQGENQRPVRPTSADLENSHNGGSGGGIDPQESEPLARNVFPSLTAERENSRNGGSSSGAEPQESEPSAERENVEIENTTSSEKPSMSSQNSIVDAIMRQVQNESEEPPMSSSMSSPNSAVDAIERQLQNESEESSQNSAVDAIERQLQNDLCDDGPSLFDLLPPPSPLEFASSESSEVQHPKSAMPFSSARLPGPVEGASEESSRPSSGPSAAEMTADQDASQTIEEEPGTDDHDDLDDGAEKLVITISLFLAMSLNRMTTRNYERGSYCF